MSLAASSGPFALTVAARFDRPGWARIVSAALQGLIEAEREFDPARGSFGQLAATAARRECLSEVRRKRRAEAREGPLFIFRPDGEEEARPDLPRGSPPAAARFWEVFGALRPRARYSSAGTGSRGRS